MWQWVARGNIQQTSYIPQIVFAPRAHALLSGNVTLICKISLCNEANRNMHTLSHRVDHCGLRHVHKL